MRGFRSPSPADDGAGEGEEGLVDVVALNVVRRTAAYSIRLRIIPDGGAAGAGSLAGPSGQQILCHRITWGTGGRC